MDLTEGRVSRPSKHWPSSTAVYVMVGAAVCVVMVGHTVNQIWSGLDLWLWLGSTREFAARPLHPFNPILVVESGDPYLSF